jgi:plasmid stabilization system protein ParE
VIFAQPAKAARNHALARCESEVAMIRLLPRFDATEHLLHRFPQLGRAGRQPGTRELVVAGTAHVFIYELTDGDVRILDIVHGRRLR